MIPETDPGNRRPEQAETRQEPGRASFRAQPDKESPLWDTRSPIIYWWTATEDGKAKAMRIVYNGQVLPTAKESRPGTLAFRAVRSARSNGEPAR